MFPYLIFLSSFILQTADILNEINRYENAEKSCDRTCSGDANEEENVRALEARYSRYSLRRLEEEMSKVT